jgi:short-subunit dehydrogenase
LLYPALSFIRWIKFLVGLLMCEDVRGKVILITGASSGIGEHMTYQYAKRGARLVIVARREYLVKQVADHAMKKGAVDVHVIVADVTKQEDCKRFVDETVNKYGRLDHLVNNAGIVHSFFFETAKNTAGMLQVMEVVFWGSVYPTFYALPHLRRSQGKILVTDSIASVIPHPRQSIYNAAKAALLQFFETLRLEMGDTIGITIMMPGMFESEITKGKFVSDDGELSVKPPDQRDAHFGSIPVAYAEDCARAAVLGVLRSRRYVVVPYFYWAFIMLRIYAPEILETIFRTFYVYHPQGPLSKVILEKTKTQRVFYPQTIGKQH